MKIFILIILLLLGGCSFPVDFQEQADEVVPESKVNNKVPDDDSVIQETDKDIEEFLEDEQVKQDEPEIVEIIPEIFLNGPERIVIEFGSIYREQGASSSNFNPSYSILTNGFVNAFTLGEYRIEYQLRNSIGKIVSEKTRIIIVEDSTPPTISLNGSSFKRITKGFPYFESSVLTFDNYPVKPIIVQSGTVDTNTPGLYLIQYQAIDYSGNKSIILTRTIEVVESHQTINLNSTNYREYLTLNIDMVPKSCNTFNIQLIQNPLWEYDFRIILLYSYLETTPQSPIETRRIGELVIRSNQSPRLPYFISRCEVVGYELRNIQGTVRIPNN